MSRVLLACGGTGGHLAPGIALAQRLTEDGHECLLIVSSKIVDARMTSNYPHLNFVPGKGRGFGPSLGAKLLRPVQTVFWHLLLSVLRWQRRLPFVHERQTH